MGKIAEHKDEIYWNIINSLIAGALVFLGAFTGNDFNFSIEGLVISLATALIVAVGKFRDYWLSQEGEYRNTRHLFCFIGS